MTLYTMEPMVVQTVLSLTIPTGGIITLCAMFIAVQDKGIGESLLFKIMQCPVHCHRIASIINQLEYRRS